MTKSLIIRAEEPSDWPAVRGVVVAAFGQAAEADLVEQLRHDGDSMISLIAVEGDEIVGHVLLSRMRAPFRALSMAPVSVVPARQRSGIGSRLIRAGLERAACDGWQAVFVVGEPAFYRRFGFKQALAGGFDSPYAGPYLMAIALQGSLPASSGRVDYAPAFGRLG